MYLNFEYGHSDKVTLGGSFIPIWFKDKDSGGLTNAWTLQPSVRYYILEQHKGLYVSLHSGVWTINTGSLNLGFAISPEYGYYVTEDFSVLARYQFISGKEENLSFLTIGLSYNFIPYIAW